MATPSAAAQLRYEAIRSGTVLRLCWDDKHPLKDEVYNSALGSSRERVAMRIAGTPFAVFTELSLVTDGNSSFQICAAEPLADGTVAPGEPLYYGAVACQLATAPLAWRHILRCYYAVISMAVGQSFSAPGLMPKEFPWMAGFETPVGSMLPVAVRRQMWPVLIATLAFVLPRCEQGCRAAELSGDAPVPNPEQYSELEEWSE